ncbi:hypothetical protein J3E64_001161 [Sphingobium sp. OAS761]|uniref:hypothetical protein n=1 Tax=Sphingobium sp. OAS761 TaxID=2817901 RepID=UPI0020A07DEA|nr:hypothetical protein [Sphingobium sp. OAS761]MCP1469486.1 hypothetical protein [Sphingobium sp. OAS761]
MAHLSGLVSSARLVLGCTCLLGAAITPQVAGAQGTSTGVPIKHAETNSIRAVQFFASQKSAQGLMLAVYGASENAKNAALGAASELRAAGYPLRGIIFGPARDDAPSVIEFYADAQLTATFLNPDQSDKAAIVTQLKRGYSEIVRPRLTGSQ